MRTLVIGGSGYVGGLIIPFLKQRHKIRVLDLKPPQDTDVEFVQGSIFAPEDLRNAMAGMAGLAYLAMGIPGGDENHQVVSSLDVNVKGVYLALAAAVAAGVRRAVYASTLSVYDNWAKPVVQDEATPPDATHVYGFTKRLGEEVFAWFARTRRLSSFALRLCGPVSDAQWQAACPPSGATGGTSASDVARAFHLALEADRQGFTVLHITGDYENRITDLSRARAVLGWEPLARPGVPPRFL